MAVSTTLTETIISPAVTSYRPLIFQKYLFPLQLTGILSRYQQRELTPLINTAFDDIDLAKTPQSEGPESDAIIHDLAITISQRGVCVFPGQKNSSIADHKLLCHRLGQLPTRPYTSGLNIHPLNQTELPDGTIDAELTTLACDPKKKLVQRAGFGKKEKKQYLVPIWKKTFLIYRYN